MYLQAPAREVVLELLPRVGTVDAFLAANDSMALGVIEALHETGRSAIVASVNAVPEAIAAIKRGELLVTADFNAMDMAAIATECAARHLRGESVPKEVSLPARLVDASNCDLWDRPYEARETPAWEDVVSGSRCWHPNVMLRVASQDPRALGEGSKARHTPAGRHATRDGRWPPAGCRCFAPLSMTAGGRRFG